MWIFIFNKSSNSFEFHKSYGHKDTSKLVKKRITDKNGHSRFVWVKNNSIISDRKHGIVKRKEIVIGGKYSFTEDEYKILSEFIESEKAKDNYESKSLAELNKYINGSKGSKEVLELIPPFHDKRINLRKKIQEMQKELGVEIIGVLVPEKLNKELQYADKMYEKCRLYNREDISKDLISIEEIEIYIKSKDWFTEYQKSKFSLKGIDLELAKDILNTYNFMFVLFPGMKGRLAPCYVENLNKNVKKGERKTYAKYVYPENIIKLDKEFYGDLNKLKTSYFNEIIENEYGITESPRNTDFRAIFVHELIHSIDYEVIKVYKGNDINNPVLPSEKIADKLEDELKLTGIKVAKEISRYAIQDKQERLAEAMSEFICSTNPGYLSQKFAEEFFKIMYTRGNLYERY